MRLIITMYTGCQFPYYKLENLGSRFGEDVEINLAVVDNQLHIIYDIVEKSENKDNQ